MQDIYVKWKNWQYYILIGVISLVALFFLPMLGSEAGLAWKLPTTFAGWVVYIVSKLLVATLNVLIFHCFILQAKTNVNNDERYIEACTILEKASLDKADKARSPAAYFKEVYGKKGMSIFFTSIVSAVGLTQAVLTFDWISMLTYFFTILMGLIFGILQMNQTETFWTTEFLRYAKNKKEEADEAEAKRLAEEENKKLLAVSEEQTEVAEREHLQQVDDSTGTSGSADILESDNSNRDYGNN